MIKTQQNQRQTIQIIDRNKYKPLQPSLEQLLIKIPDDKKISAVPLEFQYIPVEMLSKEFTKFNNPHKFRIHYLGPRPLNSFILHKKYGSIQFQPNLVEPACSKDFNKYGVNLRRIVQSSFINQGLRTNNHYRNAIFYRAFQGMNPTLNLKDQIIFNSAFQSGNLDCVIKPRTNQFDLFLRIDSNTRGHTQWYYFSVKNGKKNQKIKLNICNITKGKTLYEQGMKPYIFSRKKKQRLQSAYSWEQGGQNITFQIKPLRYDIIYENIKVSPLYELSFEYKFEEDEDEVFFAYSIPFTYSQLLSKLYQLPDQYVRQNTLGKTFTGVDIPVLHITNFNSKSERKQRKKNILITGRVHPGQSNSSHMINGLISFFISNDKQAQQLRERVNLFIVPMVNPDGVIMGNSRTSAAGKDLNRQFKSFKFQLYPQVNLVKCLAFRLKKQFGLFMYLDFHGHSRKKNTFFYGPPYSISDTQYYKCRVFPKLVQKINSSFRYYSCSFTISEEKKRTGRSVMFEQIKIPYTYTIQSSIGLYFDFQRKTTAQFQAKAWSQMGKNIGTGLSQFITLEEEYEQNIKQRIAARQRAKESRRNKQKNNKEEDQGENNQDNVDSKKNQNDDESKYNLFQGLLQEIRQTCSKPAAFQGQISSDDHDANQDLQAIKLNQFNNLIVQSAQKQQGVSLSSKFFEDEFLQEFPSKQLQNKTIKQSSSQIKPIKRQNKLNQSQNLKFRTKYLISKSQNIKKKQPTQEKFQDQSPSKSQIRRNQKNFVVANKQRYSIATKNFLINESNKYQIIDLPKNIQNIRKQLTKGRILINNLFQNKIQVEKSKQKEIANINFEYPIQQFDITNQRSLFTPMKFKRSQPKDPKLNPSLLRDYFQNSLDRRSSTSHITRKSSSSRPSGKTSPKRKQTIDNNLDYETFADLQVDNLAMTIKTFKNI